LGKSDTYRNETVIVELPGECRLRLYGQVTAQMEKKGYNPLDWKSLKLGFELPPDWPVDKDAQPTLAQLIVIAHKLGMQIVIDDLNVIPQKETGEEGVTL